MDFHKYYKYLFKMNILMDDQNLIFIGRQAQNKNSK